MYVLKHNADMIFAALDAPTPVEFLNAQLKGKKGMNSLAIRV